MSVTSTRPIERADIGNPVSAARTIELQGLVDRPPNKGHEEHALRGTHRPHLWTAGVTTPGFKIGNLAATRASTLPSLNDGLVFVALGIKPCHKQWLILVKFRGGFHLGQANVFTRRPQLA